MKRSLLRIGLLWVFMGFSLFPPAADSQAPPSLFPEMTGWKKSDTLQVFSPDNLYDYINGAADLYLTYEFKELQVGEYNRDDKASVIVEIYRHGSPTNAFGIYSQERLANADFLDIGSQGYYEEKVLNFLSGSYYVKISSANTSKKDREILSRFARETAEKLGGEKGFPALLAAFPEEGKVKNAEKFIGKNFLGYSFFPSAFIADYQAAGQKFKLFIMVGAGPEDCRARLQRYFQQLKQPGETLAEGRHEISDPYHGNFELFWKGKYIGGILNLSPSPLRQKYLSSLETRLP
ncbi:MAG: hypothetical protein EHM27_14100 [Deltaproteobacteria bacterium]|nr:MAG: hypothetical protein EHM27_14100 [Deltaproteobacteria bacterium]